MMDFLMELSHSQKSHDAIWVFIGRFAKSTHFLLMKSTFSVDRLTKLYVEDIVILHGVLVTIVSNRDPLFTSLS